MMLSKHLFFYHPLNWPIRPDFHLTAVFSTQDWAKLCKYVLEFENGLLLTTKSCLWMTASQKEELLGKFEEVVDAIRSGSLTIEE